MSVGTLPDAPDSRPASYQADQHNIAAIQQSARPRAPELADNPTRAGGGSCRSWIKTPALVGVSHGPRLIVFGAPASTNGFFVPCDIPVASQARRFIAVANGVNDA
jgi:hypothetical protein